MSTQRAPGPVHLSVTSVRPARPDDLSRLREIETTADLTVWPPATTGGERAREGGFLLVVGQPAVGFARVIELGSEHQSHLHLEQLSVLPELAGHGLGTMLLLGVLGEALDRGSDAITLTTSGDVPGNGPWYARHGFTELDAHGREAGAPHDAAALLEHLRHTEERIELHRHGRHMAMIRALADHPTPIPAVSVIPLRDGPGGLEAFVQHRAATMDFAPGAVVFPGGRVDRQDRSVGAQLELPAGFDTALTRRWRHTAYSGVEGTGEQRVRTLLATAVRELAEETGVVVAPRRLVPWDNWVTPIGYTKRFDVSFFVLPVERDTLTHTTTEATDSEWLSLDELVDRAEARELALVPPTRTIVDELQRLGSVAAVLALEPVIRAVRNDVTTLRPRPSEGSVGGGR